MPFEALLAPDPRQDPQCLLDLGIRVGDVDPEQTHLLLRRPSPCADIEPAAGEQVEHGQSLGDADGVIELERHQYAAVADPDPLRAGRDERQEDLRRGHVRVPRERVMLDSPDRVEAHLFREHRLIDAIVEDTLLVGGGRIVHLSFEDHREPHVGSPSLSYPRYIE